MRRVPVVGVRRGTQFAAALLLGGAVLVLAGCLGITAVDAPSGPPSATYSVTVTLDLTEDEFESPIDVPKARGTLAVRFPEEWELVSATYAGSVAGRLTHSSAISDYFTSLFNDPEFYDPEAEPDSGPPEKPGYTWWAGYSAVHPGASLGPWEVTLVFDQHDATGFFSLDFVGGVTDPDLPNDIDSDLAWWFGGAAFERPVFTGVPVEDVAPVVTSFDTPLTYAAVGQPLSGSGWLFDPDSDPPVMTITYGDDVSEPLQLEPYELGNWGWGWEHAWQEAGTYEVIVRADDGTSTAEATAVVNVGISPFSDVSPDHEFFPAIVNLFGREVLSGYPDDTFRPYEPVLRAQFAKMAVGAFDYHDLEITNVDSPTFSDVPPSTDPYPFDYVEEAAGNFLVTGFADGTFRPWEPLTRIQLLRILVRSREFYLEDPPAEYRMPFGDVPDADRSFVAIAHYNGLVNGKDATRFDPYGLATRGHVAKILYNALENSYEWPEEELTPAGVASVRELSLTVRE